MEFHVALFISDSKKLKGEKIVQNSYKLNQQLDKNKEIVEVLKSVNCTQNSPLKEKLYELEKLHSKYSVYVLCVILDLYSRKVIGYKLSKKHTTNLVSATFKKAFTDKGNPTNLTFHSDQGIQFTANSFQLLLKNLKVSQSYSPKGKPTHNTVMESFFSNLKREEVYRNNYKSIAHLKKRLDAYMDFYNNLRPHVTLKYLTPNDFECLKLTVQK